MKTKFFTGAALALILAGNPVLAQEWADWDTDADLGLTEEEFTAGATEQDVFGGWDADESGVLDEDEFYGGVYNSWDMDDDLQVSEAEFGENDIGWFTEADYGDTEYGDYGYWDTDASGYIDEEEYGAGIYDTGLYDRWAGDADGIYEEDFYGGIYGAADYNQDAMLTEDEGGWFDWF